MARKPNRLTPWQEMELQAYHAYREWPLFLKLRLRELRRHLPPEAFTYEKQQEPKVDTDNNTAEIALLKEYGLMVPEKPADDG